MLPQLMHEGLYESQPKVTFYTTLVIELRGDVDQYMYSNDRCYTSLAQANERLALLSRSNTNVVTREQLRAGEEKDTGCQWVTWSRPDADANKFRFYGQVKRVILRGILRTDGFTKEQAPEISGGLASTAEFRYMFEHKKDLANHIWLVAVHTPDREITLDDDGRPKSMPWAFESVHEASGNAMARGKRLWREDFREKVGAFDRYDLHYGYARYLLVPLSASTSLTGRLTPGEIQRGALSGVAQIRVERIKIEREKEMIAMFTPAEAILYDKPFRPLCRDRVPTPRVGQAEAELFDLLDDAGEERPSEDQLYHPTPAVVSAPPIRQLNLPHHNQPIRSDIVQEYGQLAAVLRNPAPADSLDIERDPKYTKRFSVGKSVASAGKQFYDNVAKRHSRRSQAEPSVDQTGSPHEKKEKHPIAKGGIPLETPGQVALAASQHLFMASRAMRM